MTSSEIQPFIEPQDNTMAVAIIKRARETVQLDNAFCKLLMIVTDLGGFSYATSQTRNRCYAADISGHLYLASSLDSPDSCSAAFDAVEDTLKMLEDATILQFNDHPKTTAVDIVALFDLTLERLQAEGNI